MSKYLYKNYWVSLKQTSRNFIYAERRNINSTATLLYVKYKSGYKFLLRYQPLPEIKIAEKNKLTWSTLYPCCVTGSIENNEKPIDNAIKEVLEETNYQIKKSDIKACNIVVSSTQMNECVYVYVADITNANKVHKKQGDGSIFENISKNKWVSYQKLEKIVESELHLSTLSTAFNLFKKLV